MLLDIYNVLINSVWVLIIVQLSNLLLEMKPLGEYIYRKHLQTCQTVENNNLQTIHSKTQ